MYTQAEETMKNKKILIVEPGIREAKYISQVLTLAHPEYKCCDFSYIHDALLICTTQKFDVIVTAYDFPGIRSLAYLNLLRSHRPEARIIILAHRINHCLINDCRLIRKPVLPEKILEIVVKAFQPETSSLTETKTISPLKIRETLIAGFQSLDLEGALSLVFVQRLQDYISRVLRRNSRNVVLNFAQVARIDNSSVAALLDFLFKNLNGLDRVVIIHTGKFTPFFTGYYRSHPKIVIAKSTPEKNPVPLPLVA
jgi:ABC-type transporter Mla MlaB component